MKKETTGLIVSPHDWQRAKPVMTVAAGLEGEERARCIQTQFAGNPVLTTQLLSMLQTYDRIKNTLGVERTIALSEPEPQQPATPAENLIQIGGEYGRYRVVRSLGVGGMGEVFLAEDTLLGRHVALKTLSGRWLGSATARQRLLREGRAAAALTHPHIATLYDILENERYFLLVMEYVEGRTAAAVVGDGPFSLNSAVRLTADICGALMYAHDRGIIHCDLKPSNLQVDPNGAAKVLDFGLAHAKYDWYEFDVDKGLLVGTPAYMPPERLLTGDLNASGDIYSLGVTLFELITGKRPFAETDMATLTGAILGTLPPKASSLVADCPADLDNVLERALAKDPKDRYQSAGELAADLKGILRGLDGESIVVPGAAERRPYARVMTAAGVALGTLASLTFAGFLTSTFYGSPLGLTMDFEGESPMWWPVWGLRSLILPLGQLGLMLLLIAVTGQLWRTASTVSKTLRHWRKITSVGAGKIIGWLTLAITPEAAILMAQIITLALFLWRFGDLCVAFQKFFMRSGTLAALGPDYAGDHISYMRVLSVLVLIFTWSWYRLLKSQTRERPGTATLTAGVVIVVVTFSLMVTPYRLLFHSDGERAIYDSQVCYLVGQRGDQARLFCPKQGQSWDRLVKLDDRALQRTGTTENIFSAPGLSKPR